MQKSDLLNSFKAARPQTQIRLVGFTMLFLASSGVVCASLREMDFSSEHLRFLERGPTT